ncbi:DUF2617 family protein [Streptomyces sp. NPDC049906]|uniref:DUF2617 family protein n=1 Tax=Streptomyces sp. NPDC049906 TaxID=3155656 RepID=UPI003421CE5C
MSGASAVTLATPYLDTDADQLSFSLDEPARAALVVRDLTVNGTDVQLRVLGASHQVFVGPVRETVACLPGSEGGLTDTTRMFDKWAYRFSARVETLDADDFRTRVEQVRRRTDVHPRALYGIFPGASEAVTALTVDPRATGLDWHTWHTYPQSCRIVATHTRLEAR